MKVIEGSAQVCVDGKYYVVISTGLYRVDPELAESVARNLGVTLVVRDTLFDPSETLSLKVCDAMKQFRFDCPQFEQPAINNRAARRAASFARRTNSDGWSES